ncbi:ADP-ribosylglycohydrolase family protein [Microbacterium kyungheense]|uniref:ADP-ribosylglycohydrolase n=1 Tax=Microbacterium kyungheense TaxID=1263636 RepID=A0A543FKE8_9MICO|nr:ADP-ribosylglycohydrolase family protein [Microbacterium kyungheense]TQM34262.1 ADP-ribosylglycohydrolase [Microbacterium kyungheense]
MPLTAQQLDRSAGSVIGMAVGDALGSQYEFGPQHPDDFVPQFGVGYFGHDVGEWTDDTSMAMPILDALARGDSLGDPAVLGTIAGEWDAWAQTSRDVGAQTRAVLGAMRGVFTEEAARAASESHHRSTGRSGGNGSLMRTGPVALGYLADGREHALADAAGRIAQLTHWEQDNVDAVVIWTLMIRHAVRTGQLDLRVFRGEFGDATPRFARWAAIVDEAATRHPRDYQEQNGWVVRALQAALAAVAGATDFRDAMYRAIRGGGDTDTVAAIAGSLAGALFGASGIPDDWRLRIHGWPGYTADDLERRAVAAVGAANG